MKEEDIKEYLENLTDLMSKDEIRKEVEEMLDVKVNKIRTLLKGNKKYAYIKLNQSNPAIDVATKLGMI